MTGVSKNIIVKLLVGDHIWSIEEIVGLLG